MIESSDLANHQGRSTLAVAIVTRNRADNLCDCLCSVFSQQRLPDQVLVVDNASTDNTAKVCDRFRHEYNLDYVYCSIPGISHARNAALNACRASIICFTDDDCEPDSTWMGSIEAFVRSRPDCSAIQGRIDNFYPESITAMLTQFQRDLMDQTSVNDGVVERAEFCCTSNFACHMPTIVRYGLRFDPALIAGEDIDIGRQFLSAGKLIGYADKAVIRHKWKTSPVSYLKRRFATGKATARLLHRSSNTIPLYFTAGLSNAQILALALKRVSTISPMRRCLFLFLLFSSNVVKKIGYLLERLQASK